MSRIWVLALCCGGLPAQTSGPRFEVAAVKPSMADGSQYSMKGGPGTPDPSQLAYRRVDLLTLIYRAYEARPNQISLPDWTRTAYFDISAKIPSGATMNDVPSMLRDLLEQRFHIQVHHETREMRAYALTVGKDGARLKAHPMQLAPDTSGVVKFQGLDKEGVPVVAPGHVFTARMRKDDKAISVGALEPIQALCNALSSELQEPVIDETGLTERYDFRLVYAPAPRGAASQDGDRAAGENVGGASDPGFTSFRAVESQLGLKLEHKRLAVDFLVVDSVDRTPAVN